MADSHAVLIAEITNLRAALAEAQERRDYWHSEHDTVAVERNKAEAQVALLQAALASNDKEFAILIEAMKAIAYDDPCGQHHDAMAQDALRLAYNVSDDDFCAKPQEGDAGQP